MMSLRAAPSLVKYAQLRYASYQPVLMQSMTTMKLTCSPGKETNRIVASEVDYAARIYPYSILHRSYSSNQPKLPSKNELENAFFKITVVIWDFSWKITLWAWAMFKKHIILNPTVQSTWKTFNDKLEYARKN